MGRRKKICWIVSDSPGHLDLLTPVLESLGLEVISLYQMMSTSATVDGLLESLASKADLVVGVLERGEDSPNIYYELGFAAALRKRIVVLAPEGQSPWLNSPRFLVETVNPRDREAVRTVIQHALYAPRPKREVPKEPSSQTSLNEDRVNSLLDELNRIRTEQAFELFLRQLFMLGGDRVLELENRAHDRGYDFLVWSEALQPYLGNPLPVEVKLSLPDQTIFRQVVQRLSSVKNVSGAQWKLLVVKDLPEQVERVGFGDVSFPVLVIRASDLVNRLRTGTLVSALVEARNRKAHGGR